VSDGSGASAACAVSVIDPGETLPDPDTDTWAGTIATPWYVDDRQPHEYRIETGAQLAGFAKLVNAGRFFAGSTFILTNNIDLAGREWTPIGYSSYYFMGTFDGGGHTISNMRISMRMDRSDLYAGLFGRNSGIIKDVCLSNVYSTHPGGRIGCAGGLVGHNAGTITGCASSGLVSSNATTSSSYAGGLVGYNDGTITDCASSGSVSSVFVSISSSYAGGLVGHNPGTITGCASSGSVSSLSIDSSSYAGGLVGYNNGTITDCASSGSVDSKTTISSSSSSPSAGGLVGWNDGGRIEDCASKTGKVSAHAAPGRTAYSGGFIGYVAGGTLINNHNETRITPAIGRDMRKNPAGPSDDI
ncbi:MAG: hypothetical protein LBJ22_02700, partial [Synergistaceae bacterium]|jgi:hypothetical protein|nr:hypothetical protein [Synergistaceae bacterium]